MKNLKSQTPPALKATRPAKSESKPAAPQRRPAEYAETDVITVLAVPEARADSLRAARWTLLSTGMTVGRFLDAAAAGVPSRMRLYFLADLRRLVAAVCIRIG